MLKCSTPKNACVWMVVVVSWKMLVVVGVGTGVLNVGRVGRSRSPHRGSGFVISYVGMSWEGGFLIIHRHLPAPINDGTAFLFRGVRGTVMRLIASDCLKVQCCVVLRGRWW